MLIVCVACLAINRVPAERAADAPVCGRCRQPLLDGRPVELGDANFDAVVSKTDLPVLVDVWAPWCGPCKMMAQPFEAAALQLKGRVLCAKVNSDENPGVSSRFAIRSIPTLLLLRGGSEVRRQSGALTLPQIVAWATSAG